MCERGRGGASPVNILLMPYTGAAEKDVNMTGTPIISENKSMVVNGERCFFF